MPLVWLISALLQVPPDWTPVIQRGPAPLEQDTKIYLSAQASAKWLIGSDCLLFLGPNAEIEILPPRPGECARIRHRGGPLRAVAAGVQKLAVESAGAETLVQRAVYETEKNAHLIRHDASGTQRQDSLHWGARAFALDRGFMQSITARVSEDAVQTGSASGSMCLNSSSSAGDVGNSSSSVIQMPPRARVIVRVPLPSGR